jgi:hypothetical protein
MRDRYLGNRYGCSDKIITENEFAIIAEGNKYSSAERVAKLSLYHAAHVTIKNKREFFQILHKTDKNLPSHQLIAIPIGLAPIVFVPVAEISTVEVTSILIIRLVEKKETLSSNYISAKQVIAELKPIFTKNKHITSACSKSR